MKLVLMAGGEGVRLRPLTYNMPKPMLPVNKKPMMEYSIEWARENGITEVIICSGYLSNRIEEYFGDGSKFGVNIKYSVEEKPLGTAGALKHAKELIGNEEFIMLQADVLCKVDFKKLMNFHKERNAMCTLVVQPSSHPEEADIIELGGGNKVVKFWKRPHDIKPSTNLGNTGLHVFNPKVLDLIPDGKVSLENVLIPLLVDEYNVVGYHTEEFLEDMGDFERLRWMDNQLKEKGWDNI